MPPPRLAQRSCLVVVEGDGEEALCLHLKERSRSSGTRIVVRNAHGGSPRSIIEHARDLLKPVAYDSLIVLLDHDVPLRPSDHRLWEKIRLPKGGDKLLLFSEPCLEAEALRLLGSAAPDETGTCQRHLDKLGYTKQGLGDRRSWSKIIGPLDLTAARCRSPWLDTLMKAMRIPA